MKPNSKKKIRHTVEEAFNAVLKIWSISKPSKKTKGMLKKTAKKLSDQLKSEIKKVEKKVESLTKRKTKKTLPAQKKRPSARRKKR